MVLGMQTQSKQIERKTNFTQQKSQLTFLELFIKNSSDEGAVVFDGFMGSGSCGVACVNTNRNFIGIEIDEGYFNIAKKRIEEAQNEIREYPNGMGGGRNG